MGKLRITDGKRLEQFHMGSLVSKTQPRKWAYSKTKNSLIISPVSWEWVRRQEVFWPSSARKNVKFGLHKSGLLINLKSNVTEGM